MAVAISFRASFGTEDGLDRRLEDAFVRNDPVTGLHNIADVFAWICRTGFVCVHLFRVLNVCVRTCECQIPISLPAEADRHATLSPLASRD